VRGIVSDALREMLLSIFIAIASTDPFSLIEWYNPPIVIIARTKAKVKAVIASSEN